MVNCTNEQSNHKSNHPHSSAFTHFLASTYFFFFVCTVVAANCDIVLKISLAVSKNKGSFLVIELQIIIIKLKGHHNVTSHHHQQIQASFRHEMCSHEMCNIKKWIYELNIWTFIIAINFLLFFVFIFIFALLNIICMFSHIFCIYVLLFIVILALQLQLLIF